jgi:thioredoxin 1
MTDAQTKNPVLQLTAEEFDQVLAEAGDKPVMVDFYADWCGPCRMAAPVIHDLAERYQGKAVIAKVDVDAEGSLAQRFGVMSIPTVMVFKNKEKVGSQIGFAGEQGYVNLIEQAM